VAVVGAGYWGTKIIREYLAFSKRCPEVNVAGIVDCSKDRLTAVARELSLPQNRLFTHHQQVIERRDINAVHIATPNETHYPLASEMLHSGKHVLLEKPMTLTSREAFKLARLAEVNGSTLLVGHIFRFNNALRKAKKLLEEGTIGRPHYTKLQWTTLMPPPNDRNIIFDLAPHPVDIINYLFEEQPTQVYTSARSYIRGKHDLEEMAFITLTIPEDITGLIMLSWMEHGPKIRNVSITGSKGTICVDALRQKVKLYKSQNLRKKIQVIPNNTIEAMIDHFADSILCNESPNNSALIGALTVTVLEAMIESLRKNIPIRVR